MQSLNSVAEVAYRRVYPGAPADAPHTLQEFMETAKQKYGYLQWKFYFDGKQDPDFTFVEILLKTKKLKVEKDEDDKLFAKLEDEVLDLPRDAGVYVVKPLKAACGGNLVKTTIAAMDLYCHVKRSKKRYYRQGDKIFFPDGFKCVDVEKVEVTVLSIGDLDGDDVLISEAMADLVREGVVAAYMSTSNRPEDKTADRNPNTEITK